MIGDDNMLKNAIEKIVSLAAPTTYNIGDSSFSSQHLYPVDPVEYRPDELVLTSLDALVKMVENEASKTYASQIYIEVKRHDRVVCFLEPSGQTKKRTQLYLEEMTDVPGFQDGTWLKYESAMIALRSRFERNEGSDYLLNILSHITDENSVQTQDNGLTQKVTVQKGVALVGHETIKPIVNLRPYRTFQEIEQPESSFLVRLREGGEIGFFEADGGMWKLDARKRISDFITYSLGALIDQKQVIVML